MIRLPAKAKPVTVGRYRYSKLRWRALVHALDLVGTMLMIAYRQIRPIRPFTVPGRIIVVQLDHLGDAVLSTPLLAELRAAFPQAEIDVLASPSNREVFEANPHVSQVRVAERTWFERRPDRWDLFAAVFGLGRSLRGRGYDLGIDVRGDVLTVVVLALAGVPRRLGWSMGGGAFLLTDVAEWIPGRHEVRARLALLARLGITPDPQARVNVHVSDADRIAIARRLSEAWPRRATRKADAPVRIGSGWPAHDDRPPRLISRKLEPMIDAPDWLHADRFTARPPLLAVHLGAGMAAKRWPLRSWKALIGRFLDAGWRVVVVGGQEDMPIAATIEPHARLRDWTGSLTVIQTAALLERADLFIGADSGPAHLAASARTLSVILFSGTNQPQQWRPWSRHALVIRHRVPCHPCHHKSCPLADHPCMSGVSPERVYKRALRWWSRTHHSESPHTPI